MDKLQALQCEERHHELRFKETMAQRDRVFKKKSEIENMTKQTQRIQQEINVTESEMFQMQIDVKMLETEIDEMTNNIRKKLQKVVKDENKLKQSKESFQTMIRQKIQVTKEIRNQNEIEKNVDTSESRTTEETGTVQRRVWALQGEIEALTLTDDYQTKKIEEINYIIGVVGEPAMAEFEQSDCTTVPNRCLDVSN